MVLLLALTMAFQNSSSIDARHSVFNEFGGNQYHEYNLYGESISHLRRACCGTDRGAAKEDQLRKLEPAKMDPSRRTECLSGTREDILKFAIDWVSDAACSQNVLWLYGLAGCGKSTISTTIANHFRESGQLGAFLFFDRDVTERSDPTLVVRTLAYQLGLFHPQIGEFMSTCISNTPTILLSPIAFQFQKLLIDLLPTVEFLSADSHIVLVLDALDECSTAEDRESLIKLLSDTSSHLCSVFRIIITSRPDIDIRYAFQSQAHIHSRELDLNSTTTSHDISSYFQHHMAAIRAKKSYLRVDWPGNDQIDTLTERARGLFAWAATACRFINGHDPHKRLNIILGGNTSARAESALDSLYQMALESAGPWDDEDFVADFRAIMGMVLVLRNPLSSAAIDNLLGSLDGRSSIDTILQLACVVSAKPSVRVIHPSFADCLLTRSRCGREVWFFRKSIPNHTLALHCLRRLHQVLRQNVCNLTPSANPVDEALPEDIAYACMFWVDHLCAVNEEVASVIDTLDAFLHSHPLHWFEAMSILQKSRATISLLHNLLVWITVSFSASPSCYAQEPR